MHKFSPSQLSMWGNCQQSWHFAYVDGLKRKGSKTYFDFGNYTHELMHVYFQLLQQGRKAGDSFCLDYIRSRIKRDLRNVSSDNIEIMNRVSKLMEDYILRQSPRIDKGIKVLGVELHMEIPLVTPNGREVILQGFIDLLYRDSQGNLIVRDHKTGARNTWSQRKLELLPQLIEYIIMLEVAFEKGLLPDIDVDGKFLTGEISFLNSNEYKKKIPTVDEMFSRYRHTHSEFTVALYKSRLLTRMDKILDEAPERNYSGDCHSCQYFQICSLELQGVDPKHIIAQQFEKVERDYGKPTNPITGLTVGTEDSGENAPGDKASKKGDTFVLRWDGVSLRS